MVTTQCGSNLGDSMNFLSRGRYVCLSAALHWPAVGLAVTSTAMCGEFEPSNEEKIGKNCK